MSAGWNPAFDLILSLLLSQAWSKARHLPYRQGIAAAVCLLAANLALGALLPAGGSWACIAATVGKPALSILLLLLGRRLLLPHCNRFRTDVPCLVLGLLSVPLACGLACSSVPLPAAVVYLRAQNIALCLLALLLLVFLHRQHLLKSKPPIYFGIFLMVFVPLALFFWSYYQLPPQEMVENLLYLQWTPPVILSGILLLELNENRIALAARQAELAAFESGQAQQYAYYQQTAARLQQVRQVRHDIYNYIQTALYLSQDGTPEGRQKAQSLIEQVYAALDAQEETPHDL